MNQGTAIKTRLIPAFILCLVLFCGPGLSAQKKVLIVPFDRFEFHTEIPLEVINKANGLEFDQFYPALVRTMADAFSLGSSSEIQYQMIGENDYDMLRRYLRYEINNKENHYMCSLDQLSKSLYQRMLDDYGCDYMLVINWYRIIQSKESVKLEKSREYSLYTYHFIDYDLFNNQKLRVSYDAQMKFMVEPNAENLHYHGVRLADLRPVFQKVVEDISRKTITGK